MHGIGSGSSFLQAFSVSAGIVGNYSGIIEGKVSNSVSKIDTGLVADRWELHLSVADIGSEPLLQLDNKELDKP